MTKLQKLSPFLLKGSKDHYYSLRLMSKLPKNEENESSYSTAEEKKQRENSRPVFVPASSSELEDIVEPTTCCMSGCANCVWIEYAEKLSAALKGSGSDVQKRIMEKVEDPNMRAFLSMELRVRKIID